MLNTSLAQACEPFFSWRDFIVSSDDWAGAVVALRRGELEFSEDVPRPEIRNVVLERGHFRQLGQCSNFAYFEADILQPKQGGQRLENLGIVFRLVEGVVPQEMGIFEDPIAIYSNEDMGRIVYPWNDLHPARQSPIEAQVDVHFVTSDLQIGPPTRIRLQAAVDWADPRSDDTADR